MFSWHVGLVLSVGFVVMLGQTLRSRSRDTDAQSARAALRLSSVVMGVSVVCVPHYLGKQPREPFYLFSGDNLSQCTFER